MNTVKASELGLKIVDQHRKEKSWSRQSLPWCEAANISISVLKRFWRRIPIQQEAFIYICKAVGIENWEEILEKSSVKQKSEIIPYFNYDESWVGRTEMISQLTAKVNEICTVLIIIQDALYLDHNTLPWVLWFAVDFVDSIKLGDLKLKPSTLKYGIKISGWREERCWNLRVASFEQNFLIQVNEQEEPAVSLNLDSFNELNKFIYDKIQEHLQSYFGRFLNYGKEVENENSFGFAITPTE